MMGRSEDFIERAFSEEERKELLKNNKYYHADKGEFDPVEILVDGKMPQLNNQGDRFRCVMAVAHFIKERQSYSGVGKTLCEFLMRFDPDLRILFLQNMSVDIIRQMLDDEVFDDMRNDISYV